ncbi:hypothetical protein OG426_35870 [Streptomyces canus]|uniref:hypothetical protein n=1 Tax=Streptomyces canus TaxID=58343 RepID=UPI0022559866|nr:hypothetical protein [Streptomyces canus]MCX4857179.1 hypothetical protein [Streptomyces canus]WSW37445.1 hypothetical protein OG426_35870 [Streptomyces canus]
MVLSARESSGSAARRTPPSFRPHHVVLPGGAAPDAHPGAEAKGRGPCDRTAREGLDPVGRGAAAGDVVVHRATPLPPPPLPARRHPRRPDPKPR